MCAFYPLLDSIFTEIGLCTVQVQPNETANVPNDVVSPISLAVDSPIRPPASRHRSVSSSGSIRSELLGAPTPSTLHHSTPSTSTSPSQQSSSSTASAPRPLPHPNDPDYDPFIPALQLAVELLNLHKKCSQNIELHMMHMGELVTKITRLLKIARELEAITPKEELLLLKTIST